MKKIMFWIAMPLILILALAACGGAKQAVNYEIDPKKIADVPSIEGRMDSLVSILNKQTVGFSKVTVKKYDQEEQLVKYFLMVYGDVGDDQEKFKENAKTVLKQLFAWSVKFVAPDAKGVGVSYVLSDGSLAIVMLYGKGVITLKNSPAEAWEKLVEEVPFRITPEEN